MSPRTFTISFIHDGGTHTAYVEAETWEEAEAKLNSIKLGSEITDEVVARFGAYRSPPRFS